ncbi:MAG: rRNA maturation RNase YbeY [Candidatus Omnitrophica bacterium]|nr:rRNA maturation RNase YbeY [Candidatus Omnitrophota bacterium]
MYITVENQQSQIRLDSRRVEKMIRVIFRREKIATARLNVIFVSRQKITALNRRFLRQNQATDVIAFDLTPERLSYQRQSAPKGAIREVWGDIFISVDAAVRQSREFRTTVDYELKLYVAHGILHLLGYDDHAPGDIRLMRAKEAALMDLVNRQ